MVAFDIQVLDSYGEGRVLRYEREVWLNGSVDAFVFGDADVAEILSVGQVIVSDMPYPWTVGEVETIVA